MGILLSFLDPASGIRYLLRARDRFAAAGSRPHEAQCDYIFAVLALIGSRKPRVPLADRHVARAEQLLVGTARPREVDGMADFVQGLRAHRAGRWASAQRALSRAAEVFDATGAVMERLMSASWSMMADVHRQDLGAMRGHLAWFRQNLQELGGGIVSAHVELLEGYLLCVEGDFDGSWTATTRIVDMYRGRRPNVQRGGALLYRHLGDIYRGRVEGRHEFARAMREVAQFRFFDTMYAGAYAMIGALLEASALRRREPDASLRRLEWFARRIDHSPPLGAGVSDRARAYAADARGEPERALALLERAEAVARGYDRRIDLAIARFQRGLRLGGSHGAELMESARAVVRAEGAGEQLLEEDAGLR